MYEAEELNDLMYQVAKEICYSVSGNPELENPTTADSSSHGARFVFYDCRPVEAHLILEFVRGEIRKYGLLRNKAMKIAITSTAELDLHGGDSSVSRAVYRKGSPKRGFQVLGA